jgi:hypothetical protein
MIKLMFFASSGGTLSKEKSHSTRFAGAKLLQFYELAKFFHKYLSKDAKVWAFGH